MMGDADGVCVPGAVLWFQHRQESEPLYWLAIAVGDFALTGCAVQSHNVLVSVAVVFSWV